MKKVKKTNKQLTPQQALAKKKQKQKIIKICLTVFVLLVASAGVYLGFGIFKQVEGFSIEKLLNNESSIQVSANGEEYYSYGQDGIRKNVSYDDIPQVMIDAVVAAEDSRFFEHNGFDLPRIVKAFMGNLVAGRITGGGSTITQQVIKKSYYPKEEQTIERKAGEIILAIEATSQTTKQEILELYLNKIYFGYRNKAIGIYAASKYYFDKETGVMATGDVTIDGTKYHFTSDGVLNNTTTPTGSKTIKNYLAGALQPVGQALYVWGGGWNDSTRKGTSQTMTDFYNSQSSSYDYNNYRDLSTANRAKGFDCSGFVGWAAYQVMQSKSGVGSGYTVVSGEVGSYYKSMGWGSVLTQANLASDDWTVYPGDVGYDSGHTWIILGQCKDKSAVIVHSTPNAGVQIAGTPKPSGDYSSQAITLAQKYMSRYPGFTKYAYHTSSGNYIRRGNYLRWNRSTLSDPDGYLNMTADQILADLFS